MIVKILFGQRTEHYNIGETAPEALECVSEYDHEDNPTWLQGRLEHHQASKNFKNLVVVDVEVDSKLLDKILNPALTGKLPSNPETNSEPHCAVETCSSPVTHIDEKNNVYCETHGLDQRLVLVRCYSLTKSPILPHR
jgi:hypothetical protein